jgi:hypothetical protein
MPNVIHEEIQAEARDCNAYAIDGSPLDDEHRKTMEGILRFLDLTEIVGSE